MTLLTTHNPSRPLPEATASELMHIFIDQDTDALLVGACLALLAQRVPEAHELAAFADPADEARARQALLARHPELEAFLALDGVRVLRFVGRSYQLLSGPTEVFLWTPADNS